MKRALKQAEIEAWPGLQYEVLLIEQSPIFKIDVQFLLVQLKTVLAQIQEVEQERLLYSRDALEKSIVETLRDKIIVEKYTNCIYKVIDIMFDQHPTSFKGKQSYADILREKF